MDTPSTLPATIPEGTALFRSFTLECIEHPLAIDRPSLPLSTDVVCSYRLAVGLPVPELVVVERAVDDAGSGGPGTGGGPQSTGTASRQVDSTLRSLGEGLERNQEQLVILRENLAETRRVVSESVAADSPQLVSRVTALCEDRVSALADSLLQRPEVSDRFHRIEAKVSRGDKNIASRYEPLTRSLDMLKEVVRQRDDRQAEFDRQLREQKANLSRMGLGRERQSRWCLLTSVDRRRLSLSLARDLGDVARRETSDTVTRALGEFKEEMTTLRSARSREEDEFKADITDLRLSLGALERKCEMKIEQKLEGVQRKGRELDKIIATSRKWMEEGVQANKASMDAMLRQKADELQQREEKLLADCRAASEGIEMSTHELVQKNRSEILAEVHLEIMEVERKLSTCAAGKKEEIAGVEERLGKLEGEVKKRRTSGHPSSGRVVTITTSTPSLGDDPSSSEDSYDEMQRDIKYDHICSRLDKLEKIAPRVSQAEAAVERLTQGQSQLSDAVSAEIASSSSVLRDEVEKLGGDAWEGINSVKEALAGVSEQLGGVLSDRSKLDGVGEELRRVADEVRRLKERGVAREEFENCMTDVDAGRARIEDRVREMSSALQALESKLEAVRSRVNEEGLVEAVKELRVSTKEWARRTEEVEERVTNLAGNLGEGIRALERRADSVEAVEQRIGGAVERVEGEVVALRRSVAEVSGLQSSVEEMSDFLSKFPRDGFKEDAQRSIDGLKSGLAEVRVEMEEMKGLRHEIGRMGEVESRLGHVEANVEWVDEELNSHKKTLEGVDGELVSNRKALEGLTVAVGKIEEGARIAREAEPLQEVDESLRERLQELEDSVTELMALLGVVDDLAKNQTEMRKTLQGRCDKQAAEMAEEIRRMGDRGDEGAKEIEKLKGIVGELEEKFGAAVGGRPVGRWREEIEDVRKKMDELRDEFGTDRLSLEEVVDAVKEVQKRLDGATVEKEKWPTGLLGTHCDRDSILRLAAVSPAGGAGRKGKELAAMKAQVAGLNARKHCDSGWQARELQEAISGSQERVEELIERKLEALQTELVERDSEWQRMVEEQVSEALDHIGENIDPEVNRLSATLGGVVERLGAAETSAAEGLEQLRTEVDLLTGRMGEIMQEARPAGDRADVSELADRLKACEGALEKTVESVGEVEALRGELDEGSSDAVTRSPRWLLGTNHRSLQQLEAFRGGDAFSSASTGDQQATILEMQNAIQMVHSRMCRLASAIRELYSDCRTSLSTNFPEAAEALQVGQPLTPREGLPDEAWLWQGGLRIPEWTDDSLLANISHPNR
ncbi:hypothetical protein FOZ61_005360 [Perkinsus olseni]|uniref:Uncharacterized protein n=1 Tax=Perkinsus olseni TaxID=32597 RepID=A0A7J6MI82_PEROL|nr:hypothetical protein FOZ61_005360 [Perkinsus olseni]